MAYTKYWQDADLISATRSTKRSSKLKPHFLPFQYALLLACQDLRDLQRSLNTDDILRE